MREDYVAEEEQFNCCQPFNPESWDNKVLFWKNKIFLMDHVFILFRKPLNIERVMKRLDSKVRNAGAHVLGSMCLTDRTSKRNMNLYLAVDKEVPGVKNISLTGKFYSKVYEGQIYDTKEWSDDYKLLMRAKGLTIKKWFMWYITCPKCAKEYGKNYVVIICEVESGES